MFFHFFLLLLSISVLKFFSVILSSFSHLQILFMYFVWNLDLHIFCFVSVFQEEFSCCLSFHFLISALVPCRFTLLLFVL